MDMEKTIQELSFLSEAEKTLLTEGGILTIKGFVEEAWRLDGFFEEDVFDGYETFIEFHGEKWEILKEDLEGPLLAVCHKVDVVLTEELDKEIKCAEEDNFREPEPDDYYPSDHYGDYYEGDVW